MIKKKSTSTQVEYFPIRPATLKHMLPFTGKCMERGSYYTPSVGIYTSISFTKSY